MHIQHSLLTAILVSCTVLYGGASHRAQAALDAARDGADLKSEFLAFAQSKIPRTGTIVVVLEPTASNVFGPTTYAYDAASRAWFHATSLRASGRDAHGAGFRIGAQGAGFRAIDAPPPTVEHAEGPRTSPFSVSGVILHARLAAYLDHPNLIASVEKTGDGNWIVSNWIPTSPADQDRLFYAEINADGILVRTWQNSGEREATYDVWPDSPPGFPLATPRPGSRSPRTYSHVEVINEGRPELFEPDSVKQIVLDSRTLVESQRIGFSSGVRTDRSELDGTPSRSPATVPHTGQGLAQYRWPLIIGGGVVILIALLEVVRRRR